MERLKVTPGEWNVVVNPLFQSIFRHVETRDKQIAEVKSYPRPKYPPEKEAEANAILIADAGTTYNKCGKLPSELLEEVTSKQISINSLLKNREKLSEQNRELIEALNGFMNWSEDKGISGCTYGDTEYDSESAAYGYNTCLNHFKSKIKSLITKIENNQTPQP